jgi:hypothetical protein
MADLKHKRYGLTEVEWAVAEILHEGCWCEPEQELYAEEGRTYGGCGPQSRGDDARRIIAAIDGPEPTWRDVKIAARRAGYKLLEIEPRGACRVWGIFPSTGWVARGTIERLDAPEGVTTWRFEINDSGYENGFHIQNPSPAVLLQLARLVGLGGDSDER